MNVWGVHIGEESAVLARKGHDKNSVDHIDVIPLDTHLPREVAIVDGIASMKERHLFEMDDQVHLSFFSTDACCFITELDRSITEVDETLAWELDQRVEASARNYAFSYDKVNSARYICAGIPQKTINAITKRFKALGVELVSVEIPVVASLNALNENGMRDQSYFYVEVGVSSTTLVVVLRGMPGVMRTLAHSKGVIAAVQLLQDAKEDYPEVASYLLAGEAITTMETAQQLFSQVPGGNIAHPLHLISYVGETSVDKYLPLLTPAVGLSQKAV